MDRRQPTTITPTMREIESRGDGYWEVNLRDGMAWFSDWFYQQLGWPADTEQSSFSALQPLFAPASWQLLLRELRLHFEQGSPLDLEIVLQQPPDGARRWQFRGLVERDAIRQPVRIAGSVRDVTAERDGRS